MPAEREFGAQSVWPYYYAGTMGLVMRDGINRLSHVKKYSRFYSTICANIARVGFSIGTGKIAGVDPREMGVSDLVVIWGTNPVNTQVNVMTHASRARKERGAKIAAVDIYNNDTMKQADIKILLRPGTDGAFACGVMHVLFREGFADRAYMDRYTDCPDELEAHLKTRTPEWASAISGVPVEEIEAFARLVGQTKRVVLPPRLWLYPQPQRRGADACGAVHSGGDRRLAIRRRRRLLQQCLDLEVQRIRHRGPRRDRPLVRAGSISRRIGRILTGDAEALKGGPPVKAMLIQNTNPMTVAPEQNLVRQGFAREDLFMAVHEQFMTETAAMADIVLPATMFLEHDDLYYGGGHQHISVGPKLIDPPGECRSNHEVLQGLGRRLNAVHPGFEMTPRELIDATLKKSGHGDIATLEADLWRDIQPDFRTSHYLDGFAHADKKFHFKADWANPPCGNPGLGPWQDMPSLPDHWTIIEEADEQHPFRLATSPSRSYLNTSFNETPGSQAREGVPTVMIHPEDAAALSIADGDAVTLGNMRGETTLTAKLFDGVRRGVLIAESIHPNKAHIGGRGINTLTGAEAVAPIGGAAFHDNKVWIKKAAPATAHKS